MSLMPGVVTGVVKDLGDPKKLGRVRLAFLWLDETYRTDWVSIAAPMTGKKRGQFFMPELEDEVLVAFDQGKFDHPYVVGFLWNGVDTPPETNLKNRVILTPGGHTLRFEDGDHKQVILKTNGGHQITLDDDTTSPKVTVKTNGGHQIVMDDTPGAQTITIKTTGSQSLTLSDVPPSIQLQGGGRILALTGGQVTIT